MFHFIYELLQSSGIPGIGLLNYITFRAMTAAIIGMLITMLSGKKFISILQKKQIGEEIRDLGLEGQLAKKGTPTMGGILIIIALLVSVLLCADLSNVYIQLLLLSTVWFGLLGFLDDFLKIYRHNKDGLAGKWKIAGQVTLGIIIALFVCYNGDIFIKEKGATDTEMLQAADSQVEAELEAQAPQAGRGFKVISEKVTKTTIPFVKSHEFDYAWLSPFKGRWGYYCKWGIYALMIILVITACSNSVNLTDGMDGLATGTSIISGSVLGIFAYLSGNIVLADYLNIMYIPYSGEIVVFMAAFIGSLIGFLWHNSYPAAMFMGDTGSLTIGGILGVCAILIRKELLLPILCGIFFVEALSVIFQRGYFKYTKKKYGAGKRIWRMTPIHHHYQKEGIEALIQTPSRALPEAKIVTRFWIVAIILAVATLAMLKIR